MKKCQDCKWCSEPGRFAKCNAPQNRTTRGWDSGVSLVADGLVPEDVRRWEHCAVHRNCGWIGARITNSCGREARWFVNAQTVP